MAAAACALLTSSLLFYAPPPVAQAADNAGCPSPTEPDQLSTVYQVEDLADLMWVKGGSDGNTNAQWGNSYAYKQTADIDMSGCTWETAIGDTSDYFLGTYDGGGFGVQNLTVSEASANGIGLFGVLGSSASVEDLTITGATISGQGSLGILAGAAITGATISGISTSGTVTGIARYVGGLIGQSGANVSGSSSSATVSGTDQYVGGLIGYSAGVSDGSATGDVTGTDFVGGLAGYAGGPISNSNATGDVTGTAAAIGGLLGQAIDSVTDSFATGDVAATGSGSGVGGLVGDANSAAIEDSYATGNVTGAGNYFSGLLGRSTGSTVVRSYSTGTVTATTRFVAGLVASGDSSTSITDSYTTSTINFAGSDYVGGIIGYANGTQITSSFSAATMSGTNSTNVGGLIGAVANSGAASNSFFDEDLADRTDTTGGSQPESTSDMKNLATYSATWDIGDGWQSTETWGICDGTTYPFLTWQYDESPCSITSPTVDTAVSTSTGFTFNVTNYDSDLTYSFSATGGSASAGTASGSDMPVTVSGVSAGSSSTVTVTAARTGYASSTATVSGSALGGGGGSGGGGSAPPPAPLAAPTTPTAAPAAVPSPDELLRNEDGSPLTMSAGSGAGYLNSNQLPEPLVTTENALWTVAGEGFALQVAGPRPVSQQPRTTTSNPVPEVMGGQNVAVAVRGFAEGTEVRGWVVTTNSLMSAPPTVTWEADATGSAVGIVSMDPAQPGDQTLQFRGQTASGSTLTILFGLEVRAAPRNVRFAVTFKKGSDALTKQSKRQLVYVITDRGGQDLTSDITVRRLGADGREGRELARERQSSLRAQLIDLGVPKSAIDISIKVVKKPRFTNKAVVNVSDR